MDFDHTAAEQQFREDVRSWLAETLAEDWVQEGMALPGSHPDREAFLRNWQARVHEDGWAGIHWPTEYGGRGATLVEQMIFEQEMAAVETPASVNPIGTEFVGPTLITAGTEDQKSRFVPNILDAEEVWCQGYSEPGSGSDLASLQCRAERDGDRFHINGEKIWTTYAHYADWCFLLTRTDDSGSKHEGITVLLVDMDQDGVTTEPIRNMADQHRFNHVYFDDAVASIDNVVGEVDKGCEIAMTLSAFEHATSETFRVEQRLEDIREYCRQTTRDGTPLIEDPVVREKLAAFDERIQAAKLTHLRNVSKQMNTETPGPEGSMDMVFTNAVWKDLENFARTLLGPSAASTDGAGPDWYEDFFDPYALIIAGGTAAIQKNIIAERVLGLPSDTGA